MIRSHESANRVLVIFNEKINLQRLPLIIHMSKIKCTLKIFDKDAPKAGLLLRKIFYVGLRFQIMS